MALTTVDQGLLGTYAQYTGFKNRIINGAMVIDQRNAGASVSFPVNTIQSFITDRWWGQRYNGTTAFSGQQSTTAPSGFINSLLFTTTTSGSSGSTDTTFFAQRIEGLNVADLGWGTASAQAITISFWVRSSLTGSFSGALNNGGSSRSYPFSFTISAANTWEQKSITVAGDTSGTWLTTNGTGIQLTFDLGCGSNLRGTANAWASGQYCGVTGAVSLVGTASATFYLTGVQLEKGSTATSFDYRPYGTELALCQRYCVKYTPNTNSSYTRFAIGECYGATNADLFIFLPVQMRINTPSITTTNTASNYALYSGGAIVTCSSVPTVSGASTEKLIDLEVTVASGLTAGRAAQLIANANTTAFFTFSAEL